MASTPFQSAYSNWQKRVARYESAGIPKSVYLPIANSYLTKVYAQGSADLTNEQADAAVFAAARGMNPIETKQPTHSGITGFLGNIVGDAGHLLTSLPRLPITLAKDVVDPHEWAKTGKALGQAATDIGDPGKALRDLATSNQLSLIPGLSDAAALTTGQGREDLLRHPLFTALDVAPIAKPISAGVGASLAKASGSEALANALQDASPMSVLRGKVDVTKDVMHPETGLTRGDPSALAAMVAGKPLLAAVRAVDRRAGTAVDPITGLELGRAQKAVRGLTRKASLDAQGQFLSAQASRLGLKLSADARPQIDRIAKIFEPLGDASAVEAFTEKAKMGDVADMSAAERKVLRQVTDWRAEHDQDAIARRNQQHYPGFSDRPGFLTDADSTVAKTARRKDRTAERLGKAQDAHAQALSRVARHEALLAERKQKALEGQNKAAQAAAQRLEASHANVERAVARAPAGQKRQRMVAALDAHGERVQTERERMIAASQKGHAARVGSAERMLAMAKRSSDRAERDLQAATKAHEKAVAKHEKARLAGPPAALHPLIGQLHRTKVENAARVALGQGFDDTFKAKSFEGLAQAVGKEETKALLQDSVREAFSLANKGLTPTFVHSYDVGKVDHIFDVHPVRIVDQTERQFLKKTLDPTHTVHNMQLAMSREALNTIERDGMQQLADGPLQHLLTPHEDVWPKALAMADALLAKGRSRLPRDQLAQNLLAKEYTAWDYGRYGLKGHGKQGDLYLPKGVADNLEAFAGQRGLTQSLFDSRFYNKTMRVFRTSVLWGPRHFAHVVVGGLMPVVLDDPIAVKHMIGLVRPVWAAMHGDEAASAALRAKGLNPDMFHLNLDYEVDNPNSPAYGTKVFMQKAGEKHAALLKDFWAKTGKPLNEGMKNVEHFAQSIYQGAVALHQIGKGADPFQALEHARSLVVNTDTMSPFERTVLKQVFPFYTFTRFATKFLVQLPVDHPLRVSILASLSKQAQEEWGTGLPQTMMSLLMLGHPDAAGNIFTINFRNANPFRSIANSFTLGGFISNLNPLFSAPFIAAGMNPLDGSLPMHPEVVYDPTTGGLKTERPKGDVALAIEQFVPEVKALDYFTGWSDSMRISRAADPGSFTRQMLNTFNIPFAPSVYNLPTERGRQATEALASAQQAVTDFKAGNKSFADSIGQYALVPFAGRLVTPTAYAQYWAQQQALAKQRFPGASAKTVLAAPNLAPMDILRELQQAYGSQP